MMAAHLLVRRRSAVVSVLALVELHDGTRLAEQMDMAQVGHRGRWQVTPAIALMPEVALDVFSLTGAGASGWKMLYQRNKIWSDGLAPQAKIEDLPQLAALVGAKENRELRRRWSRTADMKRYCELALATSDYPEDDLAMLATGDKRHRLYPWESGPRIADHEVTTLVDPFFSEVSSLSPEQQAEIQRRLTGMIDRQAFDGLMGVSCRDQTEADLEEFLKELADARYGEFA